MRSGGSAVQQALAADAAAVMRQAVGVARRRGHAQVTPLHVASAMLADAAGLLRAACLRSRPASHSLQCKALELCLNVALNRLATAGGAHHPAAVFWSQQHAAGQRAPPALSNALAAAFKRAQANQRRGGGSSASSSECQRQQGAGNKVELEQLVISILDDPSVSRVMREAGFSSAEVKVNVEKAAVSSWEQSSNTATSSGSPPHPNATREPINKDTKTDVAGDAARVLDCMASGRGKRCVAVVGETAEAVVKAVMDKVSKGDGLQPQHECLRNLQFVPLSIASFRRMPREEVEASAADLRALVRQGAAARKGVVLVLEDLVFAAEAWVCRSRRSDDDHCYYCPVEHAIMDLSRLLRGGGDHDDRFWLLAFGTYASYTTCRAGEPSLEAVLEMIPVVVPHGGLAFSLGGDSELTYCGTDMVAATPASVPSWFRHRQGPVFSGSELTLSFSSPASSSKYNFPHWHCNPNHLDPRQSWQNHGHDHGPAAAESHDRQWPSAIPHPGGSSNSVSNSSAGATMDAAAGRRRPKFTELTAENLRILCSALETRVPRHKDVASGVAGAVLRRRSGVTTRTAPRSSATWLLFQGGDSDGKTAVARELARLVFGSYDDFTAVVAAPRTESFTKPARPGSSSGGGELSLKRCRSSTEKEEPLSYVQRLHEAVRENPHRVLLIDGVDRWDNDSEEEEEEEEEEAGIKSSIATGTVRGRNGDVASLEDAIVVLSCEASESWSRAPFPRRLKPRGMSDDDTGSKEDDDGTRKGVSRRQRFGLDLNAACAIVGGELEEESSLDGLEIPDAVDGVFFFRY